MKKFEFHLKMYCVAIVFLLFALLQLGNGLSHLLQTKPISNQVENGKVIGPDYGRTLTSQSNLSTSIK